MFRNRQPFQFNALMRASTLRAADGLATTTLAFVIPLMIYNATGSVSWSGFALFIEWVPRLLFIPAAGPLVDRFGSKRVLFTTNTARALILAGALVFFVSFPGMWQVLLVVAVAAGILAQVSFVAAEHMSVHLPTDKPQHKVQAIQVSIDQAVLVLGPALGGLLLWLGDAWVFAGIAGLAAIGAALSLSLTLPKPAHEDNAPSLSTWSGLRRGTRIIMDSTILRHVVVGTAILNLLLALLIIITPAMIKDTFGGSDGQVSFLWTIGALASIGSITLIGRIVERWGVMLVGCLAGIIASIAALVLGLAPSFVAYAIGLGMFLAMDGVYSVYIRTVRARIVPRKDFGIAVSVITLFGLAPYALAGLIATILPLNILLVCLVIGAFAAGILSIISFLKLKMLPLAETQPDVN